MMEQDLIISATGPTSPSTTNILGYGNRDIAMQGAQKKEELYSYKQSRSFDKTSSKPAEAALTVSPCSTVPSPCYTFTDPKDRSSSEDSIKLHEFQTVQVSENFFNAAKQEDINLDESVNNIASTVLTTSLQAPQEPGDELRVSYDQKSGMANFLVQSNRVNANENSVIDSSNETSTLPHLAIKLGKAPTPLMKRRPSENLSRRYPRLKGLRGSEKMEQAAVEINDAKSRSATVDHLSDETELKLASSNQNFVLKRRVSDEVDIFAQTAEKKKRLDFDSPNSEQRCLPSNQQSSGAIDEKILLLQLNTLKFPSHDRSELEDYKKEKARISEALAKRAKEFPSVAGVYFDRYQQRWSVNWNEGGRRVAKYFPVKTYGFDTAYRFAVQCRTNQRFPQEAIDTIKKGNQTNFPCDTDPKCRLDDGACSSPLLTPFTSLEMHSSQTNPMSNDDTAETSVGEEGEVAINYQLPSEQFFEEKRHKRKISFPRREVHINPFKSKSHGMHRKRSLKIYNAGGAIRHGARKSNMRLENSNATSQQFTSPGVVEATQAANLLEKRAVDAEENGTEAFKVKNESQCCNDFSDEDSTIQKLDGLLERTKAETMRENKGIIKEALSLPRVPGVWFDKVQCRWACNFVENKKRRAKYFPVKDYGLYDGRKLAIATRKSYDYHNFPKYESPAIIEPAELDYSSFFDSNTDTESPNPTLETQVKPPLTSFSLGVFTLATFQQLLCMQKNVVLSILRDLRNICLLNLSFVLSSHMFQEYYMHLHNQVQLVDKATCFTQISPYICAFMECIHTSKMPSELSLEMQLELIKNVSTLEDISLICCLNQENYLDGNGDNSKDGLGLWKLFST